MDNDHLNERLKQYYETHRVSFKYMAEQSEKLFGTKLSEAQLKKFANDDAGWIKPPLSGRERLQVIADKIFQQIDADQFQTGTELSALARAYIDLTERANFTDDEDPRPIREQIMDILNEVD